MLKDKLSNLKKRVARKCYPFFVFPLFIFFTPLTFAVDIVSDDIQQVRTIAESGAVSLALQSIDVQQQAIDVKSNLQSWLDWESERINIYQSG